MLDKVYYQLYADDSEIPSKVAIDPEEPSIGRIRWDSIAPPHTPTSIKRRISRVEGEPAFVNSDLFADTTCDRPLKEGHISILRTDGPGLSPNEPMAIVQVGNPSRPSRLASIPDGRYVIKSRAGNIYWSTKFNPTPVVYFWKTPMSVEGAKACEYMQVNELS